MDEQNPTTLKLWETIVAWYLKGNRIILGGPSTGSLSLSSLARRAAEI